MKTTWLRMPNFSHPYALSSNDEDMILAGIEKGGGYYEPHIMNALRNIVRPNAICLDIGANIGAISLGMSTYASQGKVYAFEPSEANFNFLTYNVKQNNRGNIEPLKLGVFDKNTEMQFSYIDFGGGWSHITTEHAARGHQETVQCVRIDDWTRERMLSKLDLIKLDVEGAEVPALKGMERTIALYKPDLIVEFNPTAQRTIFDEEPRELYNALSKLYPNLYILDFNYTAPRLTSFEQLMAMFQGGREVVDLYCTFKG
ncbi:FkbM family methyltransferase [Paenibacillus cellulosilyticus]|uniref:FkbM family methyltransferase n=1 Tax=Paenibacillus cellulosilyticus TaxID=375489 RepID=A0A2V2YZ38_9BACL|nr:FkbM family methyltransferase [Paenibacillus cellulosilyticus]PWW07523.1 FkbM family methyltransferase [Paenibacillus cellulosilyticus]QKS44323.1 FkbM family methyltransferase [Paenibacillus cellulosilyticus]